MISQGEEINFIYKKNLYLEGIYKKFIFFYKFFTCRELDMNFLFMKVISLSI